MRYCDHSFFNIKSDVNYENSKELPNSIHAVVACVYCGQVRHLYADGIVTIVIETGEVKKAYAQTSNSNNRT